MAQTVDVVAIFDRMLREPKPVRFKIYDSGHWKSVNVERILNIEWMRLDGKVQIVYKRICRKIGIPADGQHALRHTFATRCIESGIPAIVLKNWLGHTNIHITLDTYTDVFDSLNNKAVENFDQYLDMM